MGFDVMGHPVQYRVLYKKLLQYIEAIGANLCNTGLDFATLGVDSYIHDFKLSLIGRKATPGRG